MGWEIVGLCRKTSTSIPGLEFADQGFMPAFWLSSVTASLVDCKEDFFL